MFRRFVPMIGLFAAWSFAGWIASPVAGRSGARPGQYRPGQVAGRDLLERLRDLPQDRQGLANGKNSADAGRLPARALHVERPAGRLARGLCSWRRQGRASLSRDGRAKDRGGQGAGAASRAPRPAAHPGGRSRLRPQDCSSRITTPKSRQSPRLTARRPGEAQRKNEPASTASRGQGRSRKRRRRPQAAPIAA